MGTKTLRVGTEKQLRLIGEMELYIDEVYEGDSVAEASKFISTHMEAYRLAKMFAYEQIYYEDAF